MRYNRHEPDRQVRHTVSFTEEEVMLILHNYARKHKQGLPLPPTFIWYPHPESGSCKLNDPDPHYVKIGVDVVE